MSEEEKRELFKEHKGLAIYYDAYVKVKEYYRLHRENKQLKEKIDKYEVAFEKIKNTEAYKEIFEMSGVVQERDLYKEVIEEVIALHKKFCTKHGIIIFENNELIEFMNNLIDTLNKAKENK